MAASPFVHSVFRRGPSPSSPDSDDPDLVMVDDGDDFEHLPDHVRDSDSEDDDEIRDVCDIPISSLSSAHSQYAPFAAKLNSSKNYPIFRQCDASTGAFRSTIQRRPTPPVAQHFQTLQLARSHLLVNGDGTVSPRSLDTNGDDTFKSDTVHFDPTGESMVNGDERSAVPHRVNSHLVPMSNGLELRDPKLFPSMLSNGLPLQSKSNQKYSSRIQARCSLPEDDDLTNIELGDLSIGMSGLTQPSRSVLQIAHSKASDTPRLILPTRRGSEIVKPVFAYPSPSTVSQVYKQTTHVPSSDERPPPAGHSVLNSQSRISDFTSATAVGPGYGRPLAQKSPTSCGMMASIKIRHAAKTHTLPPFMISETDFGSIDGFDDSATGAFHHVDKKGTNGLGPWEPADTELNEFESATDMSLSKSRFRSHRTLKLRSTPGDHNLSDSN
ncbi:hypothetical protein EG68_08510 [Paragonimus skrjabini miyazakii]|uniref:Uncharacterized protein n=1 Tax=Paragonimus skrjabini miyazakii TaxID=59628 RepID=A0A8S9YJA2_9TREM|nr:hypothetical protein EG68_08510 [Paragonimus skrjabini miyazakii]